MDDERDALIHGAYLAALCDGEEGWRSWIREASDWVGAYGAYLGVVDRGQGMLVWDVMHHPEPDFVERYHAAGLSDPQVPIAMRLDRPRIYRDVEVLDRSDPATRHFMNWAADHAGLDHYATAAATIGDGRWTSGLSFHNAVGQGVTDADQWRRLTALAPAVRQALTLGVCHVDKLRERWWSEQLVAAGEPAALLDERGVILRATLDFEAVLRRGDGLGAVGGRLVASHPTSQRQLAAMIAAVLMPGGATMQATRIERDAGRPGYVACAWPLARERRALIPDRAAALLTLIDPLAAPTPPESLWRTAFGFTRREAEIAAELVGGPTPDDVSAALDITIHTTRVHLRQLFAKTQTTRQSELIRLLSRFRMRSF